MRRRQAKSVKAEKTHVHWRWPSPPVSEDVITKVAKQWKVEFPRDFVDCAKDNHGGRPDHECFDFPGHKEAVFSRLLSFVAEENKATLSETYKLVKDRMPKGIFPFAEDPFGNLICFDYRNDQKNPRVVFWDHEAAHSNAEKAVSKIADSFTELIGLLYNP